MKFSFIITAICSLLLLFISKPANAQMIGTGPADHTIAVNNSGDEVHTWGYNEYGQLGNGTNTSSNVPVAVVTTGVLSGKTITQVAAGYVHSIALASDGTVHTWGNNFAGPLGNGTNTDSNVPVAVVTTGVLSGKTITQVAAGRAHSTALASDGTVYTWGYNEYGQLGNGTNTNSNVPVAVDMTGVLNGKTITQVAAGVFHSIALASDGTVYTWGYNILGPLGNGTYTDSNVPVAVDMTGVLNGKTITQVAAGFHHSIALASDGTVYTWGYNEYGQLGNGTNANSNVPVAVVTTGVLSGKTITQVAAGGNGYVHSIALASDGTVYTWGSNVAGQLGNGSNTDSNVPVAVVTTGVLSGKTIAQVAAGDVHSIALASDGTVYTWGHNNFGQLGIGTYTDSNVPVAVLLDHPLPVSLSSFTAVAGDWQVILNWVTESEVENEAFILERSTTQGNFTVIAEIPGHGNSSLRHEYHYTDQLVSPGTTYYYRLADRDYNAQVTYHNIVSATPYSSGTVITTEPGVPEKFALHRNYPNPFNPSTTIAFDLPEVSSGNQAVSLQVFNALGQKVRTLVSANMEAGYYHVTWNGLDDAGVKAVSGIYFYQLQAGDFTQTKKMILMR